MTAIERLKRDHRVFRSKLGVLEAILKMEGDNWFVLRELCFTLSRQLRDHIQREDDLVAACREAMIPPPAGGSGTLPNPRSGSASGLPAGGGMNPKVLAEVVVEHHDEPEHLRTINRLFVSEHGHTLERIRPVLHEVIQGLRRHMAEEERELFPIIERTLAAKESQATAAQPAGVVDEGMTVNRILHDYPATRSTLESLFVNIPAEGCECLDEVAFRHGMEPQELLKTLEEVIGSCGCRDKEETVHQARTREL
ncbi:MAG: hemerythrin domain-containing protein [Candidatus Omnitrophica bacterium]|nr:hemerythrin domain-containing protein [Candidatus Omnitrophota bacterium]